MKFVRASYDTVANLSSSSMIDSHYDIFGRPPLVLMINTTITSSGSQDEQNEFCRVKKELTDELVAKIVFAIAYLFLFVCSLTGNLLVVWFIVRRKHLQTAMNLFVANLALADLLVCCTSLWITPWYTYQGRWLWGPLVCSCLPFFQGTSIFVSSLTLMAIAIDRYFVICHRSKSVAVFTQDHMSLRSCIFIISLIWIFSLTLLLPYAVQMRIAYIKEPCKFFLCIEVWKRADLKQYFGIGVLLLQFFFPFVIIGVSYTRIWMFLNDRHSLISEKESMFEIQRKRKLLRLLVTMVVLFAVCWFPFNVLNLLRDLGANKMFKPYFSFMFLISHLLSMTVTATNPLLYAWMNQAFRQEFFFTFPILAKLCGQEHLLDWEVNGYSARSNCHSRYSSRCNKRMQIQYQNQRKAMLAAAQNADDQTRRISHSNQDLATPARAIDGAEMEFVVARTRSHTTACPCGPSKLLYRAMMDPRLNLGQPTTSSTAVTCYSPTFDGSTSPTHTTALYDDAFSESVHV